MSPTARTLAELRKQGWTCAVVEKWIPQTKRRKDCFGFDILACKSLRGASSGQYVFVGETLGVQATSASNHSSRKAKLLRNAEAATWLAAGNQLAVWSWSKQGKRGSRKTWTARCEPLTLSDFIPEAA